ncbi:MAG TPA: hypothetical protein VL201_01795 [Patescibacteria group bacterium]|nr:hypothetical protein [Patescibacteria group bacterium]
MKKIFLTILLMLSILDNQCSERFGMVSKIFNNAVPYIKPLAIGSLAALKFGYNHLPSIQQVASMATTAYYSTIIIKDVKPHWFPGTQKGIKDPELTRFYPYDLKKKTLKKYFLFNGMK